MNTGKQHSIWKIMSVYMTLSLIIITAMYTITKFYPTTMPDSRTSFGKSLYDNTPAGRGAYPEIYKTYEDNVAGEKYLVFVSSQGGIYAIEKRRMKDNSK